MEFLYGFLAGILFWYLMHRMLMAVGFERIRQMQRDKFRREILDKAGYDRLLLFQAAVEDELSKRKGEA